MKRIKKLFIIAIPIFILLGLALYYYSSLAEVYYKTTGIIVEDKITWNIFRDGSSFETPNTNPGYENDNKVICLAKAPHPKCVFIRASVVWDTTVFDGDANITCTYGCPK